MVPVNARLDAPFVMSYMVIADGRSSRFGFMGGFETERHGPASWEGLHRHASYEIVYVLDGELVQHLENGVFRYQAGDACFLNRNIAHREGYESDCTLVFLNLRQEFFESLFAPVPIRARGGQYRPGAIRSFIEENSGAGEDFRREYLDFAGTAGLKQAGSPPAASRLLDEIAMELTLGRTGYAFRIQALLLCLFSELEDPASYHLSRIRIDSSSEEFILARLMGYMEEHKGRVGRRELSELLHYDGDYLNRIVKKHLGVSISRLGRRICMREAERLLTETGMSVSQVIGKLGFVNRTYFYRAFLEEGGVGPGEVRERTRRSGFTPCPPGSEPAPPADGDL